MAAEDMLADARWQNISWRTGTKGKLKARFAAVRVRTADGPPQRIWDKGQQHLPGDEAWLIGEHRPSGEKKYYLANLPAKTGLRRLAAIIKARWRDGEGLARSVPRSARFPADLFTESSPIAQQFMVAKSICSRALRTNSFSRVLVMASKIKSAYRDSAAASKMRANPHSTFCQFERALPRAVLNSALLILSGLSPRLTP